MDSEMKISVFSIMKWERNFWLGRFIFNIAWIFLVVVAMSVFSVGCKDDNRPPPKEGNSWDCKCSCEKCVERNEDGDCITVGRTRVRGSACDDLRL